MAGSMALSTQLAGKRVLVIGGASGIGFAIARGALDEGAEVVVASTNPAKVTRAAEQLGAGASGVGASGAVLDVKDEAAVAAFFASQGAFDHIAFTAGDWGGFAPGPLASLDLATAAQGLKVRFWGALSVAKHGATRLPPGGSFTITSGMLAHKPNRGMPLATAGAAAVEYLARGLAVDLAPVRVNCVCPGLIKTEMWDAFPEAYRQRLYAMTEGQLVQRPGEPAEAAAAYIYLMTNTFATGQVVFVEGGIAIAP